MSAPAEGYRRPACAACSKLKRGCDRQTPSCRRCQARGVHCVYPGPRVLLSPPLPSPGALSPVVGAGRGGVERASQTSPADAQTADAAVRHNTYLDEPWFLAPASWEVDHVAIDSDDKITYPDSGLDVFVDELRRWLDQWTAEHHCPFIHRRLHGAGLPGPLQHAFAAWLTYRSQRNSHEGWRVALQMAADWSRALVQEQALYDDDALDTRAHLARTQALAVYQLIGLFDGDVRARALAESTSTALVRWADQLLASARRDALAPGRDEQQQQQQQQPDATTTLRTDGSLPSTWRAWALSESIRRTWIVATLMEAAFLIQVQGFAACPGSIGFTGRAGAWDAATPRAWLDTMAGVGSSSSSSVPGVVHCRGLVELLRARPADVDAFARVLLVYGSGREAVEDWAGSV